MEKMCDKYGKNTEITKEENTFSRHCMPFTSIYRQKYLYRCIMTHHSSVYGVVGLRQSFVAMAVLHNYGECICMQNTFRL